jgi:hypothetical protein
MGQAKRGTIVSFEKAQGFGQVEIEGEGKLSFDSMAAQVDAGDLVAGASVLVETGPSRIPGRTKVTKLWRPDIPPPLDPAGAVTQGERMVNVGPYQLQLPGFWPELSIEEKPGFYGSKATLGDGVAFDFAVHVGKGDNAAERQRLVGAYVKGEEADRHVRCDTSVMGAALEGHRFEGAKARGPRAIHELYVGAAYGDLLLLGCSFETPADSDAKMRQLFFTMVGAALIRRGSSLAKDKGGG